MDAGLNGCCWELGSVGERSGKLYCAEWLKHSNCVLLAISSSSHGLFLKGRAPSPSAPSFLFPIQAISEQALGPSQISPHHLFHLHTHWPRGRQSSFYWRGRNATRNSARWEEPGTSRMSLVPARTGTVSQCVFRVFQGKLPSPPKSFSPLGVSHSSTFYFKPTDPLSLVT